MSQFEGNGTFASLLAPAREQKQFGDEKVALTWKNWNDLARREELVATYHHRLSHNSCGAINARKNSTLQLGVVDPDKVEQNEDIKLVPGIFVEDFSLVRQSNLLCIFNSLWLIYEGGKA